MILLFTFDNFLPMITDSSMIFIYYFIIYLESLFKVSSELFNFLSKLMNIFPIKMFFSYNPK